jgi:hypothetical protein
MTNARRTGLLERIGTMKSMVRVVVDIDRESYAKLTQVRNYIEEVTGSRPSISELIQVHFAMLFIET